MANGSRDAGNNRESYTHAQRQRAMRIDNRDDGQNTLQKV